MRVAVEVWCIDLLDAEPPARAELALLSTEERERHARFLVVEPASIFATTRIALRRLLARRLACPPTALRIDTDANGKPFLRSASEVCFNVSHCATCALIALGDGFAVGVDVEARASVADLSPLRATIGAASEAVWLAARPELSEIALGRLWCRKEAVLKASGVGLVRPMATIDLGDPAATQGTFIDAGSVRTLWRDIKLSQPAVAALAVIRDDASGIDVTLQPYRR